MLDVERMGLRRVGAERTPLYGVTAFIACAFENNVSNVSWIEKTAETNRSRGTLTFKGRSLSQESSKRRVAALADGSQGQGITGSSGKSSNVRIYRIWTRRDVDRIGDVRCTGGL